MKKTLMLIVMLLLPCTCSWALYGVRISDLKNTPLPPNPVKVWGKVVSETPLKISDGRSQIKLTGILAKMDDLLVVTGNWDGSSLICSGTASAFVFPSRTEMVWIPAGDFQMGTPDSYTGSHSVNEQPQHTVTLGGYWIGKYEVTRGEYRNFMEAGGYTNPAYWSSEGWNWRNNWDGHGHVRTEPNNWAATETWGNPPGAFTQTDKYPVVGVTFYEAEAFCKWAGGRLATEAEWEKAACWNTATGHSNVYPWGDAWDAEKCNNFSDTDPVGGGFQSSQTTKVGCYPNGASPYGCLDMAGNVREWCQDWFISYPGSSNPFDNTNVARVLRGGSWNCGNGRDSEAVRCASRDSASPDSANNDVGFRMTNCIAGYDAEEVVSIPSAPIGDDYPLANSATTYSIDEAVDSKGNPVEYSFDWGDGASSTWSASTSASHAWSQAGSRTVTAIARSRVNKNVYAQSVKPVRVLAGELVSVINRPTDSPNVVGMQWTASALGTGQYTITLDLVAGKQPSATLSEADFAKISVGDLLSGTGLRSGTRVISKIAPNAITVSDYPTITSSGVSVIGTGEVGYTTRKYYRISQKCRDIQVEFVNVKTTSAPCRATENPITIEAWVEYGGSTPTAYPLTFNGATSVTIPAGGLVRSDPYTGAGHVFEKNSEFWIRTYVSAPAGGSIYCGYGQQFAATSTYLTSKDDACFGEFDANWAQRKAINGYQYGSPYQYGPASVKGRVMEYPRKPVIGVLGDSVSCVMAQWHSIYPNQTWFSETLKANDLPYMEFSQNGDYAWNVLKGNLVANDLMQGIDVLICCLGRNDLSYDAGTPAQAREKLKQDLTKLWQRYAARGIPVYQTTITPFTTDQIRCVTSVDSPVVTGVSMEDVARTHIGDTVKGAFIPQGTTVIDKPDATSLTLSQNAKGVCNLLTIVGAYDTVDQQAIYTETTPTPGEPHGDPREINDWIRTCPPPLSGVIDVAASVVADGFNITATAVTGSAALTDISASDWAKLSVGDTITGRGVPRMKIKAKPTPTVVVLTANATSDATGAPETMAVSDLAKWKAGYTEDGVHPTTAASLTTMKGAFATILTKLVPGWHAIDH